MLEKIKSLFLKKSISRYENDFNLAVKRTSELGLGEYSKFENSEERLITVESVNKFCESINFYDISYKELSNQCLAIHLKIVDDFNKFFGVNGVITIGHIVRKDGLKIFHEPMEKRLINLENPVDPTKPNKVHVWITLPTLELVDFTFASTLAVVESNPNYGNAVIAMHGDDLDTDIQYVPEFVGEKYIFRAGFVSVVFDPIYAVDIPL
ncbi:hypothetical protein GCM10025882_34740 [Acinetobacter gyllenbergii]|uniref:Uncharacterized protein n=1 Tax=Acinetobacter gyllenbergii CIP 110306 = MTCC 11365 TaxID=1217657 RepID=A0A829HGS7_9GAMM|nr:hypothetical protein [Acinetobacter gyllenbergii]EPF80066.1 hypothetical protein F957_02448 [Acinetobacter gyllenbergii CIP 110306 = MTCC 11365]EPH32776.1 hypothetical protein L293_1321 [Acinetobacter gyllenbergii CIP 110306 = MTCC 11365]ESK53404.1 hypothetical protein F987_01115 [Acinetobacter gyllenbergii NIPH 230]GMA13049.1 hypothetical protein GCM10025882_34740 [Acinetobacter gyllenbergii]